MSILSNRTWEYRGSTDWIEYSVTHYEMSFQFPEKPFKCRSGFVSTKVARGYNMLSTCLVSTGIGSSEEEERYYYQSEQEKFTAKLRSHYPDISLADAGKVTEAFTMILQIANAGHRCPQRTPAGEFGIIHSVFFEVRPLLSQDSRQALMTEIIVMEEAEEEEGSGWPGSKPATRASIMELLKAFSCASSDDDDDYCGGECSICMEEIDRTAKKTLLRMPCSHSFHRVCLVNWLNRTHSCPLCRYEMPSPEFQFRPPACFLGNRLD